MKKEEQEYHHKRKEAHKIIRNKKKTRMKNVTQSIEEYQKRNNTGKMYQRVNQFQKCYQHIFSIIRNKKGKLPMNTTEKAEIWKKYFDKFLNTGERSGLIKKGNKKLAKLKYKNPLLKITDKPRKDKIYDSGKEKQFKEK